MAIKKSASVAKKITSSKSIVIRKRTPGSMAKALRNVESKVHAAVHSVLRKEGLHGVKVHAVHYAVEHSALTEPACPDCDPETQTCVMTPDGPVCLPNSSQ